MKPEIAAVILEGHAAWLSTRMAEAETQGKVLSRDRQEFLALQAALEALRKAAS